MFRRCLSSCVVVFVIAAVGVIVLFNQLSRYFWQDPPKDAVAHFFVVEEGESFQSVARDLHEQKLIANAAWFRIMAELAGMTNDVRAGTYQIYSGENYRKILATLTAGTTEGIDVRVTIPEGYTVKQMGEILAAKGLVTQEDWAAVTGVDSPLEVDPFVIAAQKPNTVDMEGYLFPDTYRFSADMSAEEIAKIMLDNMAKHVNDLGEPSGDAQGMSIHQILTLASIVEREVRQPETMKNVADIFLKRLSIGMALQADSTVNYITGGDDPSISLEDRDNTDSPYNTYKYPGLPPGPISAPSMNALKAVMDPVHNNYLYFLTTDSGEIYYAQTYDEHIANKARYLK